MATERASLFYCFPETYSQGTADVAVSSYRGQDSELGLGIEAAALRTMLLTEVRQIKVLEAVRGQEQRAEPGSWAGREAIAIIAR